MKENVYTVVGFSKGTTKKEGKPFTNVALTFTSEYDNFVGYDVDKVFINEHLDLQLGDTVQIVWGRRRDGKAYVQNLIKVV